MFLFNISSSSPSLKALVSLRNAYSGVAVFHYLSRGQKDNILCCYCYSSIIGPSYILHVTIYPRDRTLAPPPSALQVHLRVFSSPDYPSSLKSPTLPPHGNVHLCSQLTLLLTRLRLVLGLPFLLAAENLQLPPVSDGLQSMSGFPLWTLPYRSPYCLINQYPNNNNNSNVSE